VPINKNFINIAYEIQNKIKNAAKVHSYILVDTDYDLQLNRRINKWKKQDYDIIIIDEDFNESNCILVRFIDKGSRPQTMEVEEFIQLIASFEDDNDDNKELSADTKDSKLSEDNQDGGCIIM
jgi:hypothetical protein